MPQGDMVQAPQQNPSDTANMLIELLVDNWRRTGEVMGQPVASEPEAIQLATQAAFQQLQQIQAAQMGQGHPQPPVGQEMNPLAAALGGM